MVVLLWLWRASGLRKAAGTGRAMCLLLFASRFAGRAAGWKRLGIALGLPLAFGIVGLGIPALLRTHGLFYQGSINKHVVDADCQR